MARPHLAALLEDAWNRRKSDVLRERGWGTKIVPHTGYGSTGFIRVLARVLMSRDPMRQASGDAAGAIDQLTRVSEAVPGEVMKELAREAEQTLSVLSALPTAGAVELSAVLAAVRRYTS